MRRHLILGCLLLLTPGASNPLPPQWHLVEEWRVGGAADGPLSFDATLGLARLPDGGFVHYDYKAFHLYFLDARGHPLRTVGRRGNGPGEFNVVNGLTVANDGRVIVNDLMNGFSIFSSKGDYQQTIRPRTARLGTGGWWRATVLRSGELAENVVLSGRGNGSRVLRLLWPRDLGRADTLPPPSCLGGTAGPSTTIELRKSNGQVMFRMPIPFTESEIPSAFDSDGFIWEASGPASNTIERHTLRDCRVVGRVVLSGVRAPVTSEQRAAIAQRVAQEAKQWQAVPPDLGAVPRFQAWYRSLQVDSHGSLWVERQDANDHANHIEIYSAAGDLIGDIANAELPVSAVLTDTHVYGLVYDADGIGYLAAYRIVR